MNSLTFKWLTGILILALFGLVGVLYANIKEDIGTKADKEVVEIQLQQILREVKYIREKVDDL